MYQYAVNLHTYNIQEIYQEGTYILINMYKCAVYLHTYKIQEIYQEYTYILINIYKQINRYIQLHI